MLMLSAFLAGVLSTSEPLQPISPWKVDYNVNDCIISREFGDTTHRIIFAFQPEPNGFQGEIYILRHTAAKLKHGDGTVLLMPSGEKFKTTWVSGPLSGNRQLTRFALNDAFWRTLPESSVIRIDSEAEAISLTMTSVTQALSAAKTCEDNLLRQWGADPAAMISTAPPSMANWISTNDYPVSALHAQ